MSNGEIYGRHFATRRVTRLRWEAGLITHLETASARHPPDVWLAPSLFDLQVNGFAGIDFQQDEVTAAELQTAVHQLQKAGCSRFLLTLITDDWPRLIARLGHLCRLRAQSPALQAAIVGWHIEGPFLSAEPGFHGAHNPAWMCDPTAARVEELRATAGGQLLLLTLAPERPGALAAIEFAVAQGIRVSLGHTNASRELLHQAVAAGAAGFTHLANGCPQELDRHDNILWRVLETPGLTISLIPDRIHVSPALFRIIHRAISPAAICYASDATAAAGAPPGRYQVGTLRVDVGADQVIRQPGGTNFAGSALRPIDGVFRAAQMLHGAWQAAWARFSERPARFMGLPLAFQAGQPANFCVLKVRNHHLESGQVFVNGNLAEDRLRPSAL